MKKTESVSVFPVGFAGGLRFEGPICQNKSLVKWRAHYALDRLASLLHPSTFFTHLYMSKECCRIGWLRVDQNMLYGKGLVYVTLCVCGDSCCC